ncbi:MAG: (2Fe-2S)-binding protein [Verrucomicrobiaceae bacterium]|nr:MAG: (2Fe-2S)-binding protein [Verrucomicrobiaceae bacterium]
MTKTPNSPADESSDQPRDSVRTFPLDRDASPREFEWAAESRDIKLRVNGGERDGPILPWTTLLDFLRDTLQLTGTKKGCDHGQCGACTVLIDGVRVNSCLLLAIMQEGREIVTVEGIADGETLHPLQQAFIDQDAFQCGYCTPGQICSAMGLMNEGCPADDDGIRELMSGNLCRCGAYPNILAAIKQATTTSDSSHETL